MKSQLIGLLVLLLTVSIAPAQDDDAPPKSDAAGAQIAQTPEFKAFMDAFISARNSKDHAKVDALYDPASRALMTKTLAANPDVVALFAMVMYSPVPAKHDIAVQVIPPDAPLPMAKMGVTFAVRPQLHVFLSFSPNPHESQTEELFLAKSGDKWLRDFSTFPKENTGETAATAVSTSAVTDYTYNAAPQDAFDHVYTWQVQLNAADSESGPYEIDQVSYEAGSNPDTGESRELVGKRSSEPNKDGFVDFELGIGGKKPPQPFGDGLSVTLNFKGHGTSQFASLSVILSGTKIDNAEPSPKGTQMSGGQLLLMRYHVSGSDAGPTVVDIVLRHPPGNVTAPPLTVADAQKQAVAQYPDLGRDGTPLHAKFMELYRDAKGSDALSDPSWPLLFAMRASSLVASGSVPAWCHLESNETYICDFELQPGESKNIDLPATKTVKVGFKTNVTMEQADQIGKLKDFGKHLPTLGRRNSHEYIGSTFGGSFGMDPAGNVVPLRATNKTSFPLKFVIYIKSGESKDEHLFPPK